MDGHDVGSGETNIFIFTADPRSTFDRAKPILQQRQQLGRVTAAYRPMGGNRFTVIWPQERAGDTEFSVV